jgi:uncharacterized protein (TIGR02271 family)
MNDRDQSDVGSDGAEFETSGDEVSTVRHEEELVVGSATQETGSVRARKFVDSEHVEKVVPRDIEFSDRVDHLPPDKEDSGQVETLPDGSVSIPVFEEEIVITKRLVVRERVILRKRTVTEEHLVEAEVRQERVEVEVDPGIHVTDVTPSSRGFGDEAGEEEQHQI